MKLIMHTSSLKNEVTQQRTIANFRPICIDVDDPIQKETGTV